MSPNRKILSIEITQMIDTMLFQGVQKYLDEFHFRRLENSVINMAKISLIVNLLPSNLKLFRAQIVKITSLNKSVILSF